MANRFTVAFRTVGWLAGTIAAAFVTRAVYEQTFMTWRSGPQMLGFSVIHQHPGLFLLGVIGTIFTHLWLLIFGIAVIFRLGRGRTVPAVDWGQFAVLLLVVGLLYVPYEGWQYASVKVAGAGPKGAEQLSYASGAGKHYLVKALLEAGVPVDAQGSYGTALNQACRSGRVESARYLCGKGASLDTAPDCRSIPEFAAKMKAQTPVAVQDQWLPKPDMTVEVH